MKSKLLLLLPVCLCVWVAFSWPKQPAELFVVTGRFVNGNNGLSNLFITNACVVINTTNRVRIENVSVVNPKSVGFWIINYPDGAITGCTVSNSHIGYLFSRTGYFEMKQ